MFYPEYDRRPTLRRGAGILLFLLALALLGPGLFGLLWDTDTPRTIDKWLFVSTAALYLAAALTVIAWRVEPATFFWTRSPPTRARRRLVYAVTFSLVLHGLLFSLRFGIPGLGLPGLALPWGERRVQAIDLTVRLAETPSEAAPAAAAAPVPRAVESQVVPRAQLPAPRPKAAERKARAQPRPQIIAQNEPQPETFSVPPPKPADTIQPRAPQIAEKMPEEPQPAVLAAEQAGRQAEEAARKGAEEEARRVQEAARQRALALQKEQEAKKIEEARRQEEETLRDEAKKQEEASRLAVAAEALKRLEEAARQAARQKELQEKRQAEEAAARAKEAADRQRAEADAAAQRERLAAPGPGTGPAPGGPGSDLAAKALDQIRKSPLRADSALPPVRLENLRRRSIFGTERDVPLRMYVESWRSKIERNGSLNYKASASNRAARNPIATVSIRSDGSLESVALNQSSGVRELDLAVLNIARLYAPYSKFPPALAAQFDVLEIRREWVFESTLRLLDAKN